MNTFLKLVALATISLVSTSAFAHQEDSNTTAFEQQIEITEYSVFSNPPGSEWISVRCPRNTTCYPPQGFNFRNFSTETKGSDCKGSQKRRVKQTKDYIRTSSECSVRGRVYVIPSQYCLGNARFCS